MATRSLRHRMVALLLLSSLAAAQNQTVVPSIPSQLPGNWTSIGCYTDISTSRTLAAMSLVQDPMTIETCIAYCDAANYVYAGLEYSHCDSALQIPSQPAPLTDCDMPCSGNATEVCGGPVRLSVFYSNRPPPVIVQRTTSQSGGLWTYVGCFTDSVSARTLGTGVNIPGGTTAESCTAACLAAGNFTYAGLENGHECWCDTAINPPTQHVGDADCRMVCQATHTEFCGNQNRVAIYQYSASGVPPGHQACLSTSLGNYSIVAEYKDPPTGGPTSVPLKIVTVELVKDVLWTVLSACPLCGSEWTRLSLQNSIINPHSDVLTSWLMTSTAINDGDSPGFVASIPAYPGFQGWCSMTDTTAPVGSPAILAYNGIADAFSLCTNTSVNAGGRPDVVFSPVTGHPNYVLEDCQGVKLVVGS